MALWKYSLLEYEYILIFLNYPKWDELVGVESFHTDEDFEVAKGRDMIWWKENSELKGWLKKLIFQRNHPG